MLVLEQLCVVPCRRDFFFTPITGVKEKSRLHGTPITGLKRASACVQSPHLPPLSLHASMPVAVSGCTSLDTCVSILLLLGQALMHINRSSAADTDQTAQLLLGQT